MRKWNVRVLNARGDHTSEVVEAETPIITECGDLILNGRDGLPIRCYAHEWWHSLQRIEDGQG